MASLIFSLMLLLLAMSQDTLGCFPMNDVFEGSTVWSQDLRNPWRRLFVIGQWSDDFMTVETQTPEGSSKADVTCLKKYRHHRYLVKVKEPEAPDKFQCFQFTLLTHQVVRLARTEFQLNRMEVNCDSDKYFDDVEVLIAYRDMSHKACPLLGGYQVLFHESQNIKGHCLDSVQTYNPRLEFGCSGAYVVADFGEACAPNVPIQTQGPFRQKFGSLLCVGSWDELEGNVKAILLHISYDPYRFWCIHYYPVNGSSGELLNVHISFNGKCSRNVFKKNMNDLPEEYRAFATLARFVPSTDKRCFEEKYTRACQLDESKCSESKDCPSNCKRCNENIKKRDCGFTDAIGYWTAVDSGHGLTLDVKEHGFEVTEFGIFSCWDTPESKTQGDVYSVVRNDPYSSCMPFYACAKLSSPCPGILNFFLVASDRDDQSGRPPPCGTLARGEGILIPPKSSMITLLNKQKLHRVSCNIEKDMLFPTTLGSCQISVKKCSGSCGTLYADYDPVSCASNSRTYELEHEHVCHASLQLKVGIRGLITSSVMNDRYLCWIIFQERYLYITTPGNCNSETGRAILEYYNDPLGRFDPFKGISVPNVASSIVVFPFFVLFMIVMSYFL